MNTPNQNQYNRGSSNNSRYNRGQKYDNRHQYTLNERIDASEMRLIDDQSKQIGVLSRTDAINLAREKELDLVLVAENAKPPVVKLIDFKKFLYQESKKLKEAKKGVKKSTVKDIKLSLFIGKGDMDRLINRSREFIEEGHPVRLSLLLKGREMAKKPMGFDLLNQFIKDVGDITVSSEPKMQGRVIVAVIGKKKATS